MSERVIDGTVSINKYNGAASDWKRDTVHAAHAIQAPFELSHRPPRHCPSWPLRAA
ncbi:hypothetical protein CY34DRAFT_809665 [Suillus luteus UH-Slu-Lm8-n1]|uniref:Uncharacterized protein n=1 Tax=Suillus luteus UH-Slu-Lm8-n1 TaxID=930992 RepID=A0A0D0AUU0_9AGAM|nr:hypothetical protein CY34DRAFT_809665 [Suillus luteus UH-Slu-Lm8-n1]